jgi:hypothetical protein
VPVVILDRSQSLHALLAQKRDRSVDYVVRGVSVHLFGHAVEGNNAAIGVRRHDREGGTVDEMAQVAFPVGYFLLQIRPDLDEIAQKKLPFHQLLAFGQSFLELLLVAFRLATGTSCGWSGWPKSWGCLYPGKRPVTG